VAAVADVVEFGGPIPASRVRAAAGVPDPGGPADRHREFVVGLADVEDLTGAPEDGWNERGVAGQPPRGVRADRDAIR
jgi:hypothetical protein